MISRFREPFFTVSRLGFMVLTTSLFYIDHCTRYSMRKDLISPGYRGWTVLKRGAEVHSVVGLGSGAVRITGPD